MSSAVASRRQWFTSLFANVESGSMRQAANDRLPSPDPIVLLLNRTSFGIAASDLARAKAMGADRYLREQLAYRALDDSMLENKLDGLLPTLQMSNEQLMSRYARSDDKDMKQRPVVELQAATLARQVASPRQLFEVMVEFWTNHFNIAENDGPERYLKTVDDRDVIRAHALGKFPDLLKATARSPAMLHYLNNDSNVAGGPNENYARELMELHTLGVDGGYTEADVREIARCFTGWGIDRQAQRFEYKFFALRHDNKPKQVLGREIPAGQGERDSLIVLDLLASQSACARFIATKFVRRFVSDVPPPALVAAVAKTYTNTQGDIPSMLTTIFRSREFENSADQKFKRPAEHTVSALRTLGATFDSGDWVRAIEAELRTLGQVPYFWAAPNGYPDVGAYWLSTSALLQRWNFGFSLAENRVNPSIRIDAEQLSNSARSPRALVDTLAERILHRKMTDADRHGLIAYAANGFAPDRPLADAVAAVTAKELIGLILGSAYFQYR